MNIQPKKPNELAAQAVDLYTMQYALEGHDEIPNKDELVTQFDEAREQIVELLKSGKPIDEVELALGGLYNAAELSGLVNPLKGPYGDEVGATARERESWNPDYGMRKAENTTYLGMLRRERRLRENNFKLPVTQFLESHIELEDDIVLAKQEALKHVSIDLSAPSSEQKQDLAKDFPGGNFIFHSAKVEQIIGVLEDGELLNSSALHNREDQRVLREGGEKRFLPRHSGFEGISWSLNKLGAVPGDRYHVAGFVASPQHILKADQQLAVPARPAPYEVIQISGEADANVFYNHKVQAELYEQPGMMGEHNSVRSNLAAMIGKKKRPEVETNSLIGEPMLMEFIKNWSDEEVADLLHDTYIVRDNGTIEFSSSLFQQEENTIPVAAAWINGLIDSGRVHKIAGFEDTSSVREVIERMVANDFDGIIAEYRKDVAYNNLASDPEEEKFGEVGVKVNDLYMVIPKKDMKVWLQVLARTKHQPKGLLLYDGKQMRLEDFGQAYSGDTAALTNQLQQAIEPGQDYIDWEKDVIEEDITRDKRTGSNGRVIAERYLKKRKVIRNVDGVLELN